MTTHAIGQHFHLLDDPSSGPCDLDQVFDERADANDEARKLAGAYVAEQLMYFVDKTSTRDRCVVLHLYRVPSLLERVVFVSECHERGCKEDE